MTIKGFIQSAELVEDLNGPDRVMMLLKVQGVGPGQPRKLLIPFEILVAQDELDPDRLAGCAFRAAYENVSQATALIEAIEVGAGRVLRDPDA